MNSLDMEHFAQLRGAWDRFGEDDDAWVAIITGVGNAFCIGADLKTYIPQVTKLQRRMNATRQTEEIDGYRIDDGVKAVLRGVKLYKPIIAAVNGACVAGGMEMLGGCDLRVAVPEAYFGVMEPKRGLFAGGGTTVRLPRQIPFPAAMEFLLCADRVPADSALAYGPAERRGPRRRTAGQGPGVRAPHHRQRARSPCARPRRACSGVWPWTCSEAYRIESAIATEVFSSEDAKEGPAAFAEKRPPRWTGR